MENVCFAKAPKENEDKTDWEKIFVEHTSDNELLSRIYKELLKLNKKTNYLI